MLEVFKSWGLPLLPAIIILSAQYYVAKHNLLASKLERLSKDLEKKLFDVSKMKPNDLSNLDRNDLQWLSNYIKLFNALRRKHYILFSCTDKEELKELSDSLEHIYNTLDDDSISNNEKVHEVHVLISKIISCVNKIL